MKKIILLILFFVFFSFTFADYTPVYNDYKILESVYSRLNKIIIKSPEKAQNISNNISKILYKFPNDTRNYYILNQLNNYIIEKIENLKQAHLEISDPTQSPIETMKPIKESNFYENFYNTHWLNIQSNLDSIDSCVQYFDKVDKIARENDFPTELVLATWYMEATCKFYNPANTHWIFQIMNYNYWVWELTDSQFEQQVVDYINFVKNKRNRQNRAFVVWDSKIQIQYDSYTIDELWAHWFLYNWIKKWVLPSETMYNSWNLNEDLQYRKDWLVTVMLKVIKWRSDNNK